MGVHLIPESDNPEDDKIYLFFKENAIDGEHAGKATHARIGQLCKVRMLRQTQGHISMSMLAVTEQNSGNTQRGETKGNTL